MEDKGLCGVLQADLRVFWGLGREREAFSDGFCPKAGNFRNFPVDSAGEFCYNKIGYSLFSEMRKGILQERRHDP